MSLTNVAVIPSQANRIRALAAANPTLNSRQLGMKAGYDLQLVEVALATGDRRRIKSTPPRAK